MFRVWTSWLVLTALTGAAECTYRSHRDAFTDRQAKVARQIFEQTTRFDRATAKGIRKATVPASTLTSRNFIDEEIFGLLAANSVPSAALTTDEEFVRRVTLDLTGQLPAPAAIRSFVADSSPTKRDALIDSLVASSQFVDKWTMWWGDLLENCSFPALFDRREDGRNAYYYFIKNAVQSNMSLGDFSYKLITATGNHFDVPAGATNFPLTAQAGGGPAQDNYDVGLVKAATYFLGMSQYDCLLCHNGRGHLDQINLWGSQTQRLDAWQMAAHFARLTINSRPNLPASDYYYYSRDIGDKTTGTYDLNTTTGNRPARTPVGTLKNLTPVYRDGATPTDGNWRAAFAASLAKDPMFATNLANRFFREFFGMGLVEPYDMLDPARLDPANPPDDPWTLQATHPVLLQKLAAAFVESNFDAQALIKLIVRSNAYQMSSRYDGAWTADMVPLFARHYPRRLWAEEIHDLISIGTGQFNNYSMTRIPSVKLAMQLPEPAEPNSDGSTANFLNTFLRGNRDSQKRDPALSIQQSMAFMNDPFVVNRTKATVPNLVVLFRMTDNTQVTEEIFLTFLGRKPTDAESQVAVSFLNQAANATDRNSYLEDLVWACINKSDFQFSY